MVRLFLIVCFFILVSGCTEAEMSGDAVTLDVNFEWTKESGCSNISPPITVTNIPKETKYLKVSMIDLDFMNMDHGGCEVPYTGSNTINEGALSPYLGHRDAPSGRLLGRDCPAPAPIPGRRLPK